MPLQLRTLGRSGINRVHGDSPSLQAPRQFLREQRNRQLRLPVEGRGLVEAAAVEIVEHDALGGRRLAARGAGAQHHASGAVAYRLAQLFYQGEVADVVDEELLLDTVTGLKVGQISGAG